VTTRGVDIGGQRIAWPSPFRADVLGLNAQYHALVTALDVNRGALWALAKLAGEWELSDGRAGEELHEVCEQLCALLEAEAAL
jgi:hypothetical protein